MALCKKDLCKRDLCKKDLCKKDLCKKDLPLEAERTSRVTMGKYHMG